MEQVAREEDVQKIANFIVGENKRLSEPQIKVLVELLRSQNPLLKTELTDAEIVPVTKGIAFSQVLNLPLYQQVIDTYCLTKMSRNRMRVEEILRALNPNYTPKKKGFFSRLFGGD